MSTIQQINNLISNMPAGNEDNTFFEVFDLLLSGILNGEISTEFVNNFEANLQGAISAQNALPVNVIPLTDEQKEKNNEFISKIENIVITKLGIDKLSSE